jgi:hypothetical protein
MLEERAYSFYKHVGLDAKPKLWSDLENGFFLFILNSKIKLDIVHKYNLDNSMSLT